VDAHQVVLERAGAELGALGPEHDKVGQPRGVTLATCHCRHLALRGHAHVGASSPPLPTAIPSIAPSNMTLSCKEPRLYHASFPTHGLLLERGFVP
jgi:hypothetical protein